LPRNCCFIGGPTFRHFAPYSEERGEIGAGEGERREVGRENGEASPRRQRDGR